MTELPSQHLDASAAGDHQPPGEDPAAAREARYRQAIDEALRIGREAAAATGSPAKYSLGEMMLVVTLLGVMLALIRAFGLWGATVSFLGCLAWTNVIYPRWHPAALAQQHLVFDCVWGLLMPLVCLACDPFVFKDHRELIEGAFYFQSFGAYEPSFRRESVAAYCCIGWQMSLLVYWLLFRPWLARFSGFFLGSWIVGAMFAGVLGILLAPLGLVGSIAGIGLIAFTPLLTTYVAARRMKQTIDDGILESSEQSITMFWILAAGGFILSWLIPLQIAGWIKFAWDLS